MTNTKRAGRVVEYLELNPTTDNKDWEDTVVASGHRLQLEGKLTSLYVFFFFWMLGFKKNA
jgi:hypothetical protein